MSEQRDYRDTVFLPKTDFPMKAGLPQKEPGILARWEQEGLYQQVRKARAGRPKFILHDGPPYANGDMHIGHALNHVLKDMVVRTQDQPFGGERRDHASLFLASSQSLAICALSASRPPSFHSGRRKWCSSTAIFAP